MYLSLSIFEQQINRDEPKNAATLTKRQLKQLISKLIDDKDEMKRQLKQHWRRQFKSVSVNFRTTINRDEPKNATENDQLNRI